MTKVLSLVVVSLVLLVGCSKKSENLSSSNRKEGWTDEVYTASLDSCRDTLQDSLRDANKSRPICTCYTDGLATKYTVEELNSADTEKFSENLLSSCALQQNEMISYGIARFLRVPMAEGAVPSTIKKTLDKVKKKPAHVFPLSKEDSGLSDPRKDPLPAAPAEVPRPPAPPAAVPAPAVAVPVPVAPVVPAVPEVAAPAPAEPVIPKQVEIKYDESYLRNKKVTDFTLPKVSCSIEADGSLVILFKADTSKDVLEVTLKGYSETKHHYPGDPIEAWLTRASDGYDYEFSNMKKGEATNLVLKDGQLSGVLNYPRLPEQREGGYTRGTPIPFLSAIGEFTCKVEDKRVPVAAPAKP